MLVLSRKKGEQIVIGDDIVVTVQRLSGNRVSIGIEAPDRCRIVRGELRETVDSFRDDEPASSVAPSPTVPRGGENRIAEHLAKTLGK
jgi:carbon storage regulator